MINYLKNVLFFTTVFAARSCDKIEKTHKVFVYGTLKRGEPNHHLLKDPKNGVAMFIAFGKTKTRYPMVLVTKYHLPVILESPGKGCLIVGEVYEVNDTMLGKLDKLKDHPNFYERELDDIVIRNPKTGVFETQKCWVYFQKIVTPELLSRTCMSTYSSKGPHGLVYIRPTNVTKEDLNDDIKA